MRSMEDGGVDSTVIDCRQNQLDQMADFTTLLISLVLTYKSMMYLRLTAAPGRGVRAQARTDHHCGAPPLLPPPPSILLNQGKTEVLPVLSPTAPLIKYQNMQHTQMN